MKARIAEPPRDESSMNATLSVLVFVIPCLVVGVLLVVIKADLGQHREPKQPVARLASRPYFAHPPVFPMARSPLPLESSGSATSTSDPTETPLNSASIKAYMLWLQQTDKTKQAMFHRAVELSPRLQALLPIGAAPKSAETEIVLPVVSIGERDNKVSALPTGDWDGLIAAMERQPYPFACGDLHDRYLLHLYALRDLFVAAMNSLVEKPRDRTAGGGQSSEDALQLVRGQLEAETSAADGALTEVCRQHNLQKGFDVTVPIASP